jgi:hypothetical protein
MFSDVSAAPQRRMNVEPHSKKNSIRFLVNIDIPHLWKTEPKIVNVIGLISIRNIIHVGDHNYSFQLETHLNTLAIFCQGAKVLYFLEL